MQAGTELHKMHSDAPPAVCRPRYTPVAAGARRRRPSTGVSSHRQIRTAFPHPSGTATGLRRTAPLLKRCWQDLFSGVAELELVASDIVNLPEVETRHYQTGERLGGGATERLKRLHVYIRDGAIGLRVAAGRSPSALLEVFGPGRLLPPWLWEATSGWQSRYATALAADRKSTRLNSSHSQISYAVFCLKKKKTTP